MIEIHKQEIHDIPILHIVKSGNEAKMLPLIFFIHGFTSAKEHNLHFAYLLAEKGFRIILPDAAFHGERSVGKNEKEMAFEFWKIVLQTISELEVIKDEFTEHGLVDSEKIGLVGTSMGGIVTLGALTQYKWIKAAVSLMGSPNYEQFAKMQIDQLKKANVQIPYTNEELEAMYIHLRKFDLSNQPEKIASRPLLFWHGKQDSVVPFHPTFNFYEQIHSSLNGDIEFIVDDRAGHKVSREALLKTVAWFDSHLLKEN